MISMEYSSKQKNGILEVFDFNWEEKWESLYKRLPLLLEKRRSRIRGVLKDEDIDVALFISGPRSHFDPTIDYCVGVRLSFSNLVVSTKKDRETLLVVPQELEKLKRIGCNIEDTRVYLCYTEEMRKKLEEMGYRSYVTPKEYHTKHLNPLVEPLLDILKESDPKRVGVCKDRVGIDVELYENLKSSLEKELNREIPFVDVRRQVGKVRGAKDEFGLASLQKASEILDAAMQEARENLSSNVTEAEVLAKADFCIKSNGAKLLVGPETLVASGKNSNVMRYVSTTKKIENEKVVRIDLSCSYNDYTATLIRTHFLGGKAPQQVEKLYLTVLEAQKSAIEAVKPGATREDVNKAAEKVIRNNGYSSWFFGWVIRANGLLVDEYPRYEEAFKVGNTFVIEPFVSLEELGVRIADTVAVTEDGCEVFTKAPKELADFKILET